MNTIPTVWEPQPLTTGHDEHPRRVAPDTPTTDPTGDDPPSIASLVASGVVDVVSGHPPVPINIWRVADDEPTVSGDHRCTARMAQLLIHVFAPPNTAVVSVGHDPALAGAAGAAGRPYRSVDHVTELTTLHDLTGDTGLILVPWPPSNPTTPDDDPTGERVAGWLSGCRALMADRGVTVIALAPAPATDVYVACARLLLPAARAVGLGWLQHIIAITAPITGSHVSADDVPRLGLGTGTAPYGGEPEDGAEIPAAMSAPVHVDLLALVVRGARDG